MLKLPMIFIIQLIPKWTSICPIVDTFFLTGVDKQKHALHCKTGEVGAIQSCLNSYVLWIAKRLPEDPAFTVP